MTGVRAGASGFLAIVVLGVGCGGQDTVTPSSQTVDEATASTQFVDTNGTDPNPELSEPFPAWWLLDPSSVPTPESTELHLVVTERQCASGISAEGRIEATVSYTETEVAIAVIVNSVGGYANCPGNPPTTFTVQLAEPLGDRAIVGADPPPY